MWNLKKKTDNNELIYKTEKKTHVKKKNMVTREKMGKG